MASMSAAERSALGRYAAAVRYGLPMPPRPRLSDTTAAVFRRELRSLAKRQAAYDGVRYQDWMSYEPRVVQAVCEKLGIPYRPRGWRAQ
jgi:hypothetical protein